MLDSIYQFLSTRLALKNSTPSLNQESLPSGPRWSVCLGAGLVGALLLQFITGFVLAMHYSPSMSTAWESVWFIESRVVFGSFIRALHHHGASLIVLLAIGHGLVSLWTRAYQAPREMVWWLGLSMFGVILAFALTGYLLPWDERGYSATNVATGLLAVTPFIGESLRRIVLGASDYGHLTLTRFYAVHVFLLPMTIVFLGLTHWQLRRRLGLSIAENPVQDTDSSPRAATYSYWPDQAWRNVLVTALFIIGLVIFCNFESAPLTAPADPATSFPARPEWYFLPLYQLLHTKLFSGSLEVVASHVIPTLLVIFFAAIPFIDPKRLNTSPSKWRRNLVLAVPAVTIAISLLLGMQAKLADSKDDQYKQELHLGMERARYARELAQQGIPVEGAYVMLQRSQRQGEALFFERCASCHEGDERSAPMLDDHLSERWVSDLIRDPNTPEYYGLTRLGKDEKMEAYKLKESKRLNLARFLLKTGTAEQQKKGEKLFEYKGCTDCHELREDLASEGPNLYQYGSKTWLKKVIGHPSSFLCFGDYNDMPDYRDELTDAQMTAIVEYVYSLRKRKLRSQK